MDFERAECAVQRQVLSEKSIEEDRFKWMTETNMCELGYTQSRISSIKSMCLAQGDYRKDPYQKQLTWYRVWAGCDGTQARSKEKTTEQSTVADNDLEEVPFELYTKQPQKNQGQPQGPRVEQPSMTAGV